MSIPPYLEAARDAAMLAYLRSESDDRGVRICHANNLSVYWSGADPFEAERTSAVRLPRLLGASDIAEVHQAAAGRISGGAPVGISPVGDAASVEERAAAAGTAGSAPAPAQRTGGRPPLAELLRRRRAPRAGMRYDLVAVFDLRHAYRARRRQRLGHHRPRALRLHCASGNKRVRDARLIN